MKQILTFALVVLLSGFVKADGIEFFHGTWEEALAEATKQEKLLFVDAYAQWCGPCKRMAKTVFPQKEVGEFYNKNFINVKLDYEKKEADGFRKNYPVAAFPTLYYIDFNGEVIHAQKGAQKADGLIQVGKMALAKVDRSGDYAELYEKGERDPKLIYNYIKALNQAGKPSLKVANDYLNNVEDITAEQNLKIIYMSATEADSKIFDRLIEHRSKINKIYSTEEVDDKIEKACFKTIGKAVEYQVEMLRDEAVDKMKTHCPDRAKKFATQADILYYQGTGKVTDYVSACKMLAKKYIKKDAEKLTALATAMKNAFPLDKNVLKEAEKIAKKANKLKKV